MSAELQRLAIDINGLSRSHHAAANVAVEDAVRAVCRAGVALRDARKASGAV